MPKIFEFSQLSDAPLIVDAIYKGGTNGDVTDDPISKLLNTGNQGGFRPLGSIIEGSVKYAVLYSSLNEPDWPDTLDDQLGIFTYYGDNKKPGYTLHETRKKGNVLLRNTFESLHKKIFNSIPPFLIFTKAGCGRDVTFRGLAVPGSQTLNVTEDLVAIWKSSEGERFQNYKAIFTILNAPEVPRDWLIDLANQNVITDNTPVAFARFYESGTYTPLIAERSIDYRSREEQLPSSDDDTSIIKAIHSFFSANPHAFEKCAADIFAMQDKNVHSCDVTRPSRDGGRDAIGKYKIGLSSNAIYVDFALEAKCYNISSSVSVRDTARLISRLRNRQFGVLVTTSFVANQAYKEIKEDLHPVIIITAKDIVEILKDKGIGSVYLVNNWLNDRYGMLLQQ